jgi:hypothetical protein
MSATSRAAAAMRSARVPSAMAANSGRSASASGTSSPLTEKSMTACSRAVFDGK